ncbi:Rhodanese domain protein [Geobacter metallireducens RCH3]|nr:rhodanese-like domain-containing protein [Geobacter metallireducens]EHP86498.1 Rhodanese domain protein [Geobacter metallireducens RCH3]
MKYGFEISAAEVKARMNAGEQLFFVNLRHHQDWDLAVMQVRGALRIDDDKVEAHLEEIPRERTVVVYSTCPGDEPSARVARLLQEHGWKDAHSLIGGFEAYCQEGLPVEEIGEGSSVRKIMML